MVAADPLGRRAVGVAGAALIGASLAGGAVSVLAGVNTWSNARTAEATLATPWPMLLLQTAATLAAVQRRRKVATAGAGVLALTAGLAESPASSTASLGGMISVPGT